MWRVQAEQRPEHIGLLPLPFPAFLYHLKGMDTVHCRARIAIDLSEEGLIYLFYRIGTTYPKLPCLFEDILVELAIDADSCTSVDTR